MHKGRVVFGAMDEVVFGRPAAEAIVEQMDRLRADRAFLMVSGTLNRQTDEIKKIQKALGVRSAAIFDTMPPHTPGSPTPISSLPWAAARSPTAPRRCSFASPTISAPSRASIRSAPAR